MKKNALCDLRTRFFEWMATAIEFAPSPSPPPQSCTPESPSSLHSSPRSALKGSRGAKLDRLRWDEAHLVLLEREHSQRKRAKRLSFAAPCFLAVFLVLFVIYRFR